MFNRCKHKWNEEKRTSTRGVLARGGKFKFGGGMWGNAYDDILYGYTLILLKCEHCGDVRTRKVAGAW